MSEFYNQLAERRLWDAADEFRANSDLKSSEYATPVLGLIFLRYGRPIHIGTLFVISNV